MNALGMGAAALAGVATPIVVERTLGARSDEATTKMNAVHARLAQEHEPGSEFRLTPKQTTELFRAADRAQAAEATYRHTMTGLQIGGVAATGVAVTAKLVRGKAWVDLSAKVPMLALAGVSLLTAATLTRVVDN